MKKKALIVATVYGFVASFEQTNIKRLQKLGYEVHVATNMNTKVHAEFGDIGQLDNGAIVKHQIDFMRSPVSMKNIKAKKQLKTIIKKYHFDIIHCHTPVAGVITRLISKKSQSKIIYTAHGFHFFAGGSKLNWLIYYPIEKWLSRYTDVLVTINKEDYLRADQKFHAKKTAYIPGVGVDFDKFTPSHFDKNTKLKELGIDERQIVLLSVGELNKNKNHEVIIRAIKKLDNSQLQYVIAGKGNLDQYLQTLIEELNLTQQVKLLGYRTDIHELCQVCDVFCFPSYREGLGLAAIEALAAGKPLITGTTRGIDDYSVDGVTGFKSQDYSVEGFTEAIQKYLDNRELFDPNLLKNEAKKFSNAEVQKIMNQIYEEIIHDQSITR
ncbi:MAG: glycosyltransferase family 4 protein [Culicoidibacterales bacterium]